MERLRQKAVSRRAVAVVLLLAALWFGMAAPALAQQLVRLTFYYPVGVAGPLARVINEMVDEFNAEHPHIEVIPVYSGDYDPTMQKVVTAVRAGNPPDIAVVEISEFATLRAMDAVAPLDEYIAQEPGYLEGFFPAFLENSIDEGRVYGIPFQRSTPVLYWNKEAFAEAGLDPDRPPTTWEELREYAQKLTVREGNEVVRWGVTISGGWHDWLFEGFVRQNGAALIDFDNRKVQFNSPEAVEALEFWIDLQRNLKVAPPHSTWASTPPDFVAGKTAMLYHSTGILTFLKDSAPFPFGVAFMPGNKSYGAAVGGGNFFVFKDIPQAHKDAAWEFIRWMTTDERAAAWSMASGYVATRRGSYELPDMKAYLEEHPEYTVARDQLEYAYGKMMSPAFQQIREIVKRALDRAADGQGTPQQVLDEAQAQAERLLRGWR